MQLAIEKVDGKVKYTFYAKVKGGRKTLGSATFAKSERQEATDWLAAVIDANKRRGAK